MPKKRDSSPFDSIPPSRLEDAMRVRPNRRERQIAQPMLRDMVSRHRLLEELAAYREEILKPVVELRDECASIRDQSMTKKLTALIDMLRGES